MPEKLLLPCLLLLAGGRTSAQGFTDTFATDPSAVDHQPFMWSMPALTADAPTGWRLDQGALQFREEDSQLREARAFMWDTGVELTDGLTWSLEVGFQHLSGVAPTCQYEAVIYAGWRADQPGQYGLLSLCYDAAKHELTFLNGGATEAPIAVDLGGRFHPVRLTVRQRQVRVYVDGALRSGPLPLKSLACENPAWFILGPITQGQKGTFACQWDYFGFTLKGALAPGEGGWHPERDRQPVAIAPPPGAANANPASAFDHPPYPGTKLLSREPGGAKYEAAFPDHVKRWNQLAATRPPQLEVPEYTYPDGGPSRQNVYRGTIPLKLDDRRCVAMTFMTRGIDDTIYGFMDYKLWYCVSTDGGRTYDAERPLIQRGPEYSAAHPNRFVWIGKNGFVAATLPLYFVRLSNGQLFLPCYYAPLDEKGQYFNPNHTSTYSLIFGLIGTWNESRQDVDWDVTAPIQVTPEQSTAGLSECGVIELRDHPGHVFMAIRGGNEGDRSGKVPCWKWATLSKDYGRTWSKPRPFTFSDGTPFYSPTSQGMFLRSSRTGKAYWIGNLSRVRPRAGWPRYPLVMAELDERKLGLRRETVTILDDRGPADGSDMQLSNFGFLEDPGTGHILVYLNRMCGGPGADGPMTYEVLVR
ncbi:MAG: exo-alpha-sialidase [Armatimonadetes bacterium]|nr:exo-alpha-sialidase [Armatimonadota bacterium]